MTGSDDSGPDRTDDFNIREGGEGYTVVAVWDGFGNHSSAALTESQVSELVADLEAVPIAELEQLADEWDDKSDCLKVEPLCQGYSEAATELRSLIADYRGE